VIRESVEVIAGELEAVVTSVAQQVIAAVDVDFARHQRMQPRPQGFLVQRLVSGDREAGIGGRFGHENPLRDCERRSREIRLQAVRHVIEDLVDQRRREAVANAFVRGKVALGGECWESRERLTPMLFEEPLQGVLEVMTEGQVPQVVYEAGKTEPLLDEQRMRTGIVGDACR
jgi:hypothetical protein